MLRSRANMIQGNVLQELRNKNFSFAWNHFVIVFCHTIVNFTTCFVFNKNLPQEFFFRFFFLKNSREIIFISSTSSITVFCLFSVSSLIENVLVGRKHVWWVESRSHHRNYDVVRNKAIWWAVNSFLNQIDDGYKNPMRLNKFLNLFRCKAYKIIKLMLIQSRWQSNRFRIIALGGRVENCYWHLLSNCLHFKVSTFNYRQMILPVFMPCWMYWHNYLTDFQWNPITIRQPNLSENGINDEFCSIEMNIAYWIFVVQQSLFD